ncbi:MAG: class I SAM-dependent methyltransferase [Marinibacterium sp.]|nr:class I SAM-dependent methyltransferase [Marinibacterium sp.]
MLTTYAKQAAKSVALTFPESANSLWRWYYLRYRYAGERQRDLPTGAAPNRQDVFTKIHDSNEWKNGESVSGFGSTLYNTTRIRDELPRLIREFGVKTLLDAPCGDYNWMAHLRLPDGVEYIGCDIVQEMVDDLNARHGAPGRRFEWLDIVEGPIPQADMWLCRDTIFHLSFADGLKCLRGVAASGVRYFLATSHDFVDANHDIETGRFRFIDLCKPPYSLPRPIRQFDDFLAPNPPRILGVWSAEQLQGWARAQPGSA